MVRPMAISVGTPIIRPMSLTSLAQRSIARKRAFMAPEDFAARRVQKTIKYYSEGNLGVCPAAQRERSEEHTSELQSHSDLVCRLLLEKKKQSPHRHYQQVCAI